MAKAVKFIWDYASAGEILLRSQEMADICEELAATMTRATGTEYVSDVKVFGDRVRAIGRDEMSKDDAVYARRKNGKLVYREKKLKEHYD